jgi:hypothetical protein
LGIRLRARLYALAIAHVSKLVWSVSRYSGCPATQVSERSPVLIRRSFPVRTPVLSSA